MCLVVTGAGAYISNVIRNSPIGERQPNVFFTQEPAASQEENISFLDTYILPSETATALDYGSLPITQTVVVSMATEAAAESIIASSKSTQSAIAINNDGATSTAQSISTGTAIAAATNDEIARQEQKKIAFDEAEQQRLLERQTMQDQLEIAFEYTWKVGGSIILILVICLAILYTFRKIMTSANRKAVEAISDNLLENIQVPVVQVSTDAHSGFEHVVAITSGEYAILRKAVIDLKGRLSRRTVVRGGYFKETRWNQIYSELLRRDAEEIAFFERNTNGGISPTKAGWKWLGLTPPTPPLGFESIESLQNAAIHHATPLHASGEG